MLHYDVKLQIHIFLKSQLKNLVVLTLKNILYRQNCNIEAESINIFYFVISHLAAPRSTLCHCQIISLTSPTYSLLSAVVISNRRSREAF